MGVIWTLFDRTEKILSADARRSLADWLKNVKPRAGNPVWSQIFTGILDKVFGKDYLSWKTFVRSCIASTIALIFMTLIYFLTATAPMADLFATPNLILIWIPATFVVDYVSLCESRGVISDIAKVGTGGVILLLIGDFILTTLIFVGGGSFVLLTLQETGNAREIASLVDPALIKGYRDAHPNAIRSQELTEAQTEDQIEERVKTLISQSNVISQLIDLTLRGWRFWRAESAAQLCGIFFCSTFITSVWVWLYVLGGGVIKAIEYLGFGTSKLRRWLDVENQPMLAIGYVCMMLVTLCFVFVLIF